MLHDTSVLFKAPQDLAERFVDACYELLSQPDRIPDKAVAELAHSGWPPVGKPCSRNQHRQWLMACELDAIDLPGTTRAELLTLFKTEGGLSTYEQRTFVHRRCEYLKVDTHFSLVDERTESPDDLVALSSPHIGCGVFD